MSKGKLLLFEGLETSQTPRPRRGLSCFAGYGGLWQERERSQRRAGFYCPYVFKKVTLDLVNLYSMQKAAAAIKPVYSCSEGAPETGTGGG